MKEEVKNFYHKIGNNIRHCRQLLDKKATDVASDFDMSESAYTKYERGDTKITIDRLLEFAEYFQTSIETLMGVQAQNINIHNAGSYSHGCGNIQQQVNNLHSELFEELKNQLKKKDEQIEKLMAKIS